MANDNTATVRFSPTPAENLGKMIDKCVADTPGLESHHVCNGAWALTAPTAGDGELLIVIRQDSPDVRPTHSLTGDAELIEVFLDFARSNIRVVPRHSDRIDLYLNVEE